MEGQTETMTAATVQSSIASSRQGSTTYVRKLDGNTNGMDDHKKDNEVPINIEHTNSPPPKCKHINNIAVDSNDDICQVTLTSKIDPNAVASELGWNDVKETSKKKVPMRHAIISPTKRQTRNMYKQGSPNYNQYDPTGSIQRMSQRLKDKQTKQLKDRSIHQNEKMLKSDRKP